MFNAEALRRLEELLDEEEVYIMSFEYASKDSGREIQLIASGYKDYHKRIDKRIREEILQCLS